MGAASSASVCFLCVYVYTCVYVLAIDRYLFGFSLPPLSALFAFPLTAKGKRGTKHTDFTGPARGRQQRLASDTYLEAGGVARFTFQLKRRTGGS